MKQVDIRVIGKTEIDMNTLTEGAYIKVGKLFVEYGQLLDYKEWLWKNSKMEVDDRGNWYHTNDDELHKTWNQLDTIEYKILSIISDKSNFKGFSFSKIGKYINPILESKWLNLAIVSTMLYLFTRACASQDIFGGFCDWWLVQSNMVQFNIKSIVGGM